MGNLALISEAAVRAVVTRQLAFDAVRGEFESIALNRSQVFDVVIGAGHHNGEVFGLKSGKDIENELVGFKCGSYWAVASAVYAAAQRNNLVEFIEF